MFFFFFNDTATTEIYTLSLHDALPIFQHHRLERVEAGWQRHDLRARHPDPLSHRAVERWRSDELDMRAQRSEEHTSELQSRQYLVCRLLLEKKKNRALSEEQVYEQNSL